MTIIPKPCFKSFEDCNIWLESVKWLPRDKKGYHHQYKHIHVRNYHFAWIVVKFFKQVFKSNAR